MSLGSGRRAESRSRLLLHGQDAGLAAAGVDEQAEGKRLIGVGLEVFDGLRFAVLADLEVFFPEAGNERPVLVLYVEVDVDDLDIDLGVATGWSGGAVLSLSLGPSGIE